VGVGLTPRGCEYGADQTRTAYDKETHMRHLRIALWDVTSGTADEVLETARRGFVPIFEQQPGFVRYEAGKLDDGGTVSFSIWETRDEAHHAVELAHSWVNDNLSDRLRLREEHIGDISWDEPQ
jgi:Antibiotic biosynthesis monooxygenase